MYSAQLTVFVCVADCGSFAKAAEKIHISSAAVMKQINTFEARLGLTLFKRTNQGVYLTQVGESIYKDAKYLQSYSQIALKKARQLIHDSVNLFRIGTSILNPCHVFMDLWQQIEDEFAG